MEFSNALMGEMGIKWILLGQKKATSDDKEASLFWKNVQFKLRHVTWLT